MYLGSHLLNYQLVIIKPILPDFYIKDEDLKTIPLWIKLPNLHLSYWSANALRKI